MKKDRLEKEVGNTEAVLQDKKQEVSDKERKIVVLNRKIRKKEITSKVVDTGIKALDSVGAFFTTARVGNTKNGSMS